MKRMSLVETRRFAVRRSGLTNETPAAPEATLANASAFTVLVVLLAVLVLGACTRAEIPTGTPPSRDTGAPAGQTVREQKWDTVVAAGKKEGAVAIYGSWRPETRTSLSQAFKDKFGINLEFSPFSRGAEIMARVQAEQRGGIYQADIFAAGSPTLLTMFKPAGLLAPLDPQLILPEVLDGRAWLGGQLPYTDKDHRALAMIAMVTPTVLYNTDLVKEGEITSYRDLLKPQFKGKITINDPTVTGAGQAVWPHLAENVWNEAETTEFLRRLIRDQEAVVQRDNRDQVEAVARGKYAIGIGTLTDMSVRFIKEGAPVKFAPLQEDNRTTAASGVLGIPTKLGHPNAATVFINWLLTKEGQSLLAESFGGASTRMDARTEGIYPILVPKPGRKYYMETEEFVTGPFARWLELSKKTIAEASAK